MKNELWLSKLHYYILILLILFTIFYWGGTCAPSDPRLLNRGSRFFFWKKAITCFTEHATKINCFKVLLQWNILLFISIKVSIKIHYISFLFSIKHSLAYPQLFLIMFLINFLNKFFFSEPKKNIKKVY